MRANKDRANQDATSTKLTTTRTGCDRQVLATGELPEAIVEMIARTVMDPRHNHLDSLVENWTP